MTGAIMELPPAGSIYLDHNATTPIDPRVLDAMLPFLSTAFGHPSSQHAYAAGPRSAVARARGQVAGLLGADPDEIVFTGTTIMHANSETGTVQPIRYGERRRHCRARRGLQHRR